MSLRDSRAETSFADERHSVTAKTDWDALFRDATFMREQHAPTQKGPRRQEVGRTGGLADKIHAAVDAPGNPLRIFPYVQGRHLVGCFFLQSSIHFNALQQVCYVAVIFLAIVISNICLILLQYSPPK